MNLRTLFGFLSPKLLYSEESLSVEDFPLSSRAILLSEENDLNLNAGDQVTSGQSLSSGLCSTVTGKVAGISELKWLEGKTYTAVEIETSADEWDSALAGISDFQSKSADELKAKLKESGFQINNLESNYDTAVINCVDSDLLVCTSSQVLKDSEENLKTGINLIKHLTGAKKVIFAATAKNAESAKSIAKGAAEIAVVKQEYPNGADGILARTNGEGKAYVLKAETLSAMTECIQKGRPYTEKLVTIINRNNNPVKNVRVRIGTPVSEILNSLNIALNQNEKLILGGPMTGNASFTGDFPVTADTDCIMIQGADEVAAVEDAPCINCGKCVEVCPQKLQINLISRYSEFSIFEKCEEYDIDYCIECGMCAYVCTSRRPLVQYVQFAKNELKKLEVKAEEQEQEKKEE